MWSRDPCAVEFVARAVYQAFLSALSYHRRHAPLSEKVISTRVVAGTYFSKDLLQGFSIGNLRSDSHTPNNSQAYI